MDTRQSADCLRCRHRAVLVHLNCSSLSWSLDVVALQLLSSTDRKLPCRTVRRSISSALVWLTFLTSSWHNLENQSLLATSTVRVFTRRACIDARLDDVLAGCCPWQHHTCDRTDRMTTCLILWRHLMTFISQRTAHVATRICRTTSLYLPIWTSPMCRHR